VIVAPPPKVEQKAKIVPAVTNTGNTGAVTNAVAKDTTNAARQSRWRSKQDVVALRGQAKERMKGLRAAEGRESGGLVSDNPSGITPEQRQDIARRAARLLRVRLGARSVPKPPAPPAP
jgi:hypothetical protein